MIYTNLGPLSAANLRHLADFGIEVVPMSMATIDAPPRHMVRQPVPDTTVQAQQLVERLGLDDWLVPKAERLLRAQLPREYVARRLRQAADTGNDE